LTLHPTQGGAKQLPKQYGDRLVCVRYRYDETTKERWKAVELIIEKSTWTPPPPRWQGDTLVALRITGHEREVRQRVKAAGGKWNPREVVWELPYGRGVALGLVERIVATVEQKEVTPHLQIDGRGQEAPSTNR
jgi:hypothetical protein